MFLSGKQIFASFLLLLSIFSCNQFCTAQSWAWAKSAGYNNSVNPTAMVNDGAGHLYVTGWYNSPFLPMAHDTLGNTGGNDIFLVKYDEAGNELWSRSAGNGNINSSNSIAVDPSGNVYITGTFTPPYIAFGPDTLISFNSSMFVAKYNATGSLQWAITPTGSSSAQTATGIAADLAGNIFITGYFSDTTLDFGGHVLHNPDLGGTCMFLVKMGMVLACSMPRK